MILGLILACEDPEVVRAQCTGPLTDLTRWRADSWGRAEKLDLAHPDAWPPVLAPEALAAVERAHVATAVEALRSRKGCEETWRMSLWTVPDNPAGRLRDEALRQVLGFPGIAYDAPAIGPAGATTDGRGVGEK